MPWLVICLPLVFSLVVCHRAALSVLSFSLCHLDQTTPLSVKNMIYLTQRVANVFYWCNLKAWMELNRNWTTKTFKKIKQIVEWIDVIWSLSLIIDQTLKTSGHVNVGSSFFCSLVNLCLSLLLRCFFAHIYTHFLKKLPFDTSATLHYEIRKSLIFYKTFDFISVGTSWTGSGMEAK